MRIANKERYALQLMADLASRNTGEYTSLTAISTRQGISIFSLRAVAHALVEAGLIETTSEHLYHYRLKLSPDRIPIHDILRSTDGKFACTVCPETDPEKCTRYRVCANVLFWEGMQESGFIDSKNNSTLQDLVDYFETEKQL